MAPGFVPYSIGATVPSFATTEPFERRYKNLVYLAAPSATITVGSYDAEYQVCQINFSKRDGSIYVSFPYFPQASGLVSAATFPPTPGGQTTLSLLEGGKVTTHVVKFAQHPDGRAHFSQDGKVYTAIKRESFPLTGPIGHLFWLHAYHPYGFTRFNPEKRRRSRVYLRHRFTPITPSAITVSAEWHRKDELIDAIQPTGHVAGPLTSVKRRSTGFETQTFFLGQPDGYPLTDHVLTVSANATIALPNIDSPAMIFLGGFDHHEVADANMPLIHSGCLAFIYPATNYDDLLSKLGSIDFNRK